jgi:hypothetical protein
LKKAYLKDSSMPIVMAPAWVITVPFSIEARLKRLLQPPKKILEAFRSVYQNHFRTSNPAEKAPSILTTTKEHLTLAHQNRASLLDVACSNSINTWIKPLRFKNCPVCLSNREIVNNRKLTVNLFHLYRRDQHSIESITIITQRQLYIFRQMRRNWHSIYNLIWCW